MSVADRSALAGSEASVAGVPAPRSEHFFSEDGFSLWREIGAGWPVCLVALVTGWLFVTVTGAATTKGSDFFYYWCTSKLIVQGHATQIYSLGPLGHLERTLAAPVLVPHGVIPNVYPPFFAVALAPLALLPCTAAYFVWLGLNCLLLGFALRALERYVPFSPRGRIAFRAAEFGWLPVIMALLQGQVSLILLACLTVCFLGFRARRYGLAGVALGMMSIKPQYVLPFLLLFAVRRHWVAVGAFVATSAILILGPIAVLGPSANPAYLHALLGATTWGANVGGFDPHGNDSFAGFTRVLLPGTVSTIATLLLDVVALLALVFTALRRRSADLSFGLAVVVALLTSQHVLIHDLTLLLVPAVIAIRNRPIAPVHPRLVLVAGYVAAVVGFGPLAVEPLQFPTIALCALGVWLVLAALRARAGGQIAGK